MLVKSPFLPVKSPFFTKDTVLPGRPGRVSAGGSLAPLSRLAGSQRREAARRILSGEVRCGCGGDEVLVQGPWLVGALEYDLLFHSVGNLIILTDELIFFRGVGQPPTRWIL